MQKDADRRAAKCRGVCYSSMLHCDETTIPASSTNFRSRPHFGMPVPVLTMSKEEDWLKEKATLPLRDEPRNPANAQVTQKERSARAGDSIEGVLTTIRNFKEIAIAVSAASLTQAREADDRLLSEVDQEN